MVGVGVGAASGICSEAKGNMSVVDVYASVCAGRLGAVIENATAASVNAIGGSYLIPLAIVVEVWHEPAYKPSSAATHELQSASRVRRAMGTTRVGL